ncbi:MAG TPA: PD-(D/E)XK nuclease family protein, partial [Chthoniobacterales bacterium]
EACSKTSRAAAKIIHSSEAPAFIFAPFQPGTLAAARARASDFIRKQNPSGYEELPELPAESVGRPTALAVRSVADNAATLYGSWWHTLFQHLPWTSAPSQWQTAFSALHPASPDPDRSAREWELITNAPASALTKFLARPAVIPHTEFPFLWRMNEGSCVEGMIDLLLVDPAEGRGLLIDWKTNRIKRGEEERLRQQYKPQLAAYWKSVGEITKLEVEAGIFATATGQFLAYEAGELEEEWTRLRSLPPEQLAEEVSAL